MPRRKASTISVFFAPPQRKRLPFQGSWLGAAETERLSQICIEKPKPQIQFAVWKGRNEHRG